MNTKFQKFKMQALLALCLIVTSIPAHAAHSIKVGRGRLSLIDIGSLISNEVVSSDNSLIRIYPLSGLKNEEDRSIIAIQGLKDEGELDLSIRTNSDIIQIHVTLTSEAGEDLIIEPENRRAKILKQEFNLATKRMSLVTLPKHINEFVLAGDPELIKLTQIVADNDKEFLKTFALISADKVGSTDLVVASKSGVYKFTVKIGEDNENHAENISLYLR